MRGLVGGVSGWVCEKWEGVEGTDEVIWVRFGEVWFVGRVRVRDWGGDEEGGRAEVDEESIERETRVLVMKG